MNILGVHFFLEVLNIANDKDMLINDRIKHPQVLVIGPKGEQLGLKTREDALTLASYAGFDLVLMNGNSNPPVCKIMDYNKFKYEKNKRKKESEKKSRENVQELKEFRLSVNIDVHDFETRVKNVEKHLKKNNKIRVTIRFKGREMAHTELGKEVLLKFASRLDEISEIGEQPKLDGRNMSMLLIPKKN